MMAYVLTDAGNVLAYPFPPETLRAMHPQVSFPAALSDELLAGYGVFPVAGTTPPAVTAVQELRETTPVFSAGQWVQTWTIDNLTAAQIAAKFLSAKQRLWQKARARAAEEADKAYGGNDDACRTRLLQIGQEIKLAANFAGLGAVDLNAGWPA